MLCWRWSRTLFCFTVCDFSIIIYDFALSQCVPTYDEHTGSFYHHVSAYLLNAWPNYCHQRQSYFTPFIGIHDHCACLSPTRFLNNSNCMPCQTITSRMQICASYWNWTSCCHWSTDYVPDSFQHLPNLLWPHLANAFGLCVAEIHRSNSGLRILLNGTTVAAW